MIKIKEARLVKAGDTVLLINGYPPLVDCRVVAEDNYQNIMRYEALYREAVEALGEMLQAYNSPSLVAYEMIRADTAAQAVITKSKSILND